MRMFDSIRRSGRSLRQAKLRTILTMLAISIGSFALALTLAAGEGARQFVERLIETNFNPKSIIVVPKASEGQGSPFGGSSDTPEEYNPDTKQDARAKPLLDSDLQKLAGISGVERVSPSVELEVKFIMGPNGKKFQGQVNSTDQGMKFDALAGTIPATLASTEVVLPEIFVNAFGFTTAEEALGKQITVNFGRGRDAQEISRTFQIAAVAKKPNGLMGGARNIVLAQEAMVEVYRLQSPTAQPFYYAAIAYATTDNEAQLQRIQLDAAAMGYQSLGARELAKQITQAVNIVQYFVAGFGLIALIVSIFGIVNTQLISVLERTREIGLMKALGMSGASVLRLFIFEATWIGFGGAAMGIFGAYFASIFANPFIEQKLELGHDLLVFIPAQVGGLVVALMIIAAIAGILPAWKASRLNPIEALRTE